MNSKHRLQGFQQGGSEGDLFRGVAPFYAEFRRPYPESVVSFITSHFGLDGHGRLLDVGCGTGQVFQVLGEYFDEVVAIDPDPDMLAHAARTVVEHRLDPVTLLQMRGEDLDGRLGTFRMATFGSSFHWMDRILVGNLVYDRLEPGGHFVVLSPGGIHSGTTDWEAAICSVLEEWLGGERRAGQGIYRAGERHGEALRRTRFGAVGETDIYVLEPWSIEQIVGYLFSTSYASHAILGNRASGFERAVRERLLQICPDGRFQKTVEYTAIYARRPI